MITNWMRYHRDWGNNMDIKECFIRRKTRTPINLLNCTKFDTSETNGSFWIDFYLVNGPYESWPFDTKEERDEVYKNICRNYTSEIFDEV